MIVNQIAAKIAEPYAQALFDFSIEKRIMHQITFDFQKLKIISLKPYLENPLIIKEAKKAFLTKLLKSKLHPETFKFLLLLINRDRINILNFIILHYLKLIYAKTSVKKIYISTATKFTNTQKKLLNKKLKELTRANEILLIITVDLSLIGGFLVKIESKILNFTIKNQLKNLAKHLSNISNA